MSKAMRQYSFSSPSGGSMASPIPPPFLTPLYKWKMKHYKHMAKLLVSAVTVCTDQEYLSYTYGEHVVALVVWFFAFFSLLHVELSEEVEGHHGIEPYQDAQHHDRQAKLLAVMGDRLQDRRQGLRARHNIHKMHREEEKVEMTQGREDQVEHIVHESLQETQYIRFH